MKNKEIYVAKTKLSEVGRKAIKGGCADSPYYRMRYYTPCAITTLTPVVEDDWLHTYGENVHYPLETFEHLVCSDCYDRFATYNNSEFSEKNRSIVPECWMRSGDKGEHFSLGYAKRVNRSNMGYDGNDYVYVSDAWFPYPVKCADFSTCIDFKGDDKVESRLVERFPSLQGMSGRLEDAPETEFEGLGFINLSDKYIHEDCSPDFPDESKPSLSNKDIIYSRPTDNPPMDEQIAINTIRLYVKDNWDKEYDIHNGLPSSKSLNVNPFPSCMDTSDEIYEALLNN